MFGDKGTTLLCLHKIIASSVHPILYALSSNRALSQRFPRMDKSLKAIIASFSGISSPYPHSIQIISDRFDFGQGKLGHFTGLLSSRNQDTLGQIAGCSGNDKRQLADFCNKGFFMKVFFAEVI